MSTVVFFYALSELKDSWPDSPLGTDFVSFWTAGSMVRGGVGASLYDMETQELYQTDLRLQIAVTPRASLFDGFIPYHNPPPLALLLVPLSLLPVSGAYLLWTVLNLVASLAAVTLVPGRRPTGIALLLMITFAGVLDNLIWGQMGGLLLLVLSLGMRLMAGGRPYLGGAVLGLLWLKPQYAALFPLVFLLKGRWRELAGICSTGVALAGVSWLMVGTEGILRYLELLQGIGVFYPPSASFVLPEIMVNWRAVLVHLFPGIPGSAGSYLVVLLGLATALTSLRVWRGKWDPTSPRFAIQILVLTLATLVAAPHSHLTGAALLLSPLSLAGLRPGTGLLDAKGWAPMIVLGYLLALLGLIASSVHWLLAPYFLAAMLLLIAQDHRQYHRESVQ